MSEMTRDQMDEAVMVQLDRHPDCLCAGKWDSYSDKPFSSEQAGLYLGDGKEIFLRHYRSTKTEQALARMSSLFLKHAFTDREAEDVYELGMCAVMACERGNTNDAAGFVSRVAKLCRRHHVRPKHIKGLLCDCAVILRSRDLIGERTGI